MGLTLSAPQHLGPAHELDTFACGNEALDLWLKRRARRNQADGASRTYVVCAGAAVVGYYALAAGSVVAATAPGRVRRNMPDPVPVLVLGRLAIDRRYQKQGLGAALLRDAILRTVQAADIAGIRALLVHAIDEAAAAFYARHGFTASPIDPFTLMITLADARRAMAAP